MEYQLRQILIKERNEAQRAQELTERAIHALVLLRKRYNPEGDSTSLLKAWAQDDEQLRVRIHTFNEFLAL